MMDFDRAMNVRVNGKEVIRFALNGVTIWEKYTPASILLESDKSYASEGDTINLTATVNDKFNRPCPNKNVDFYICDQLIQSVEEPYEATRDAKYFLSEGDFTNKSIEFTVDAISGSIDILCEAATIRPFFRMTGLQVGDIVKITDDGTFVKGYVNDTLMYTANHINNPGMIGFSLPNGATLTFSHFTEKGDVLIDSDMTDDTGVATVSYLVQGSEPLSIKAKSNNIESNMIVLNEILFNPPLDGTDQITKWTNMTNTTGNGIFRSHGSFLTEGWSNTGLWQLDFDVQSDEWWYVGLMPLCDARINPFTDAKQSQYAATTWEGLSIPYGFGATLVKTCSFSKITDKNWHHVTMKKIASNQVQIFIDGGYEHIWQSDVFAGISELHFGTRDNPASRNYGGVINFKNIIVKSL